MSGANAPPVQASPRGLFARFDAAGGCLELGPALARLVGEAATADAWWSAVPADDRARLEPRWADFLTGRGESFEELRLQPAAGGPPVWVRTQASPVVGADGETSYVAHFVDVTDLHAARAESEERARLLKMSDALMGLGHWHVHGAENRLEWSDEVHRIHGTDPKTHRPGIEDGLSAYHPEDRPRIQAAVEAAFGRGEGFEFEARLVRPDGEVRIVRSAGVPVPAAGEMPDLIGVFQDVTESHEMVRRLAESEARYALAVGASQDGLWDWDAAQGTLWWSDRFFEIVGMEDRRAFSGQLDAFVSRLHPDDEGPTLAALEAHTKDRVPYDVRYRLRHEDGHFVWIRAKGQASWDDDGRPTRMVGTVADISEQVAAEAAVEDKTRELERSNAELQRFASVASHDMKEPLRKIRTFTDRIVDRGAIDDPKTLDYFERMRKAADRMHETIEDLLALARVPARAAEREPVAIADAVAAAEETLRDVLEDAGAEIVVEAGLPAVYANPTLMEQVLRNLLDNAVKYRDAGRPPRVTVRPRPCGVDWVAFEVQDNGIGFDPQYAERIFGLFERLHGRSEYSGTGLGLALCQRIVEEHGGRIEARGELGAGARFLVRMPAPPAREVAS